ncbi:MAG: hypothetical protein IKM85_06680 [Bacteroidales bacterium]|nr:hypothetical protein [Bacteroidales bacterium]
MENSLKGSCKFIVEGDAEREVEVALLPGLADSVEKLKSWGYTADVIASNESSPRIIDTEPFGWEDFVKLVSSNTVNLSRVVIQNMTNDPSIFDKHIILSKTLWASKQEVDRIELSDYINPMAFDRSKITIDFFKLEGTIPANAILYMSMKIPPKAKFGLQFIY